MIELFSPAKINLFLKVVGRRDDGYHNIASLFQAVCLEERGDSIHLVKAAQDCFSTNHPTLLFDKTNTLVRALQLFRAKTGWSTALRIHLEKRIPIGGGVGGGSSNAATLLYGLNELSGLGILESTLQAWSSEIGSDVPFFFSHGTAYCEKKGEEVTDLPPLREMGDLWLITPPWGVSTPLVYQRYKETKSSFHDPKVLLGCALKGEFCFVNDLEEPAYLVDSRLALIKRELLDQAPKAVFLTGSGSSFVVLSKTRPKVKKPLESIPLRFCNRRQNEWYNANISHS